MRTFFKSAERVEIARQTKKKYKSPGGGDLCVWKSSKPGPLTGGIFEPLGLLSTEVATSGEIIPWPDGSIAG